MKRDDGDDERGKTTSGTEAHARSSTTWRGRSLSATVSEITAVIYSRTHGIRIYRNIYIYIYTVEHHHNVVINFNYIHNGL